MSVTNDFVLRISKISPDLTEKDLRDMLAPFGQLTRVFLAKDHVTNRSRGFAFVGFEVEADAANVIAKGCGHFAIKWAQRR